MRESGRSELFWPLHCAKIFCMSQTLAAQTALSPFLSLSLSQSFSLTVSLWQQCRLLSSSSRRRLSNVLHALEVNNNSRSFAFDLNLHLKTIFDTEIRIIYREKTDDQILN